MGPERRAPDSPSPRAGLTAAAAVAARPRGACVRYRLCAAHPTARRCPAPCKHADTATLRREPTGKVLAPKAPKDKDVSCDGLPCGARATAAAASCRPSMPCRAIRCSAAIHAAPLSAQRHAERAAPTSRAAGWLAPQEVAVEANGPLVAALKAYVVRGRSGARHAGAVERSTGVKGGHWLDVRHVPLRRLS
jgi:hypothetical protein